MARGSGAKTQGQENVAATRRASLKSLHGLHRKPARESGTSRSWRVAPARGATGQGRSTRKPHKTMLPLATVPVRRAFSSRGALYRYHKAKGTLHEYFAMFGIDYRPD